MYNMKDLYKNYIFKIQETILIKKKKTIITAKGFTSAVIWDQ